MFVTQLANMSNAQAHKNVLKSNKALSAARHQQVREALIKLGYTFPKKSKK